MSTATANEFQISGGRTLRLPSGARQCASAFGLVLTDVLVFWGAALIFHVSQNQPRFFVGDSAQLGALSAPISVFLTLAVLFVVCSAIAGDYVRRQSFWDGVERTSLLLLGLAALDLLLAILTTRESAVLGDIVMWLFLLVSVPAMRQCTRWILSRLGLWKRRAVLVGDGRAAEVVYGALNRSLSMGLEIDWLISVNSVSGPNKTFSKLRRMNSTVLADIGRLVEATGCNFAIVALDDEPQALTCEIVDRISEANIKIAFVPTTHRLPLHNLKSNVLLGGDILFFRGGTGNSRWPQHAVKRSFDIVMAALALLVISPVFAILAILVKRHDGGPAFYSQMRIGRNGAPFRCFKFRTMFVDADARLCRWQTDNPDIYEEFLHTCKLRDDPRVTPIGRWLRSTSLDELPQLLNILRGEMSFVGPRPVLERELVENYGAVAEFYMRVRPGLTGLWQISGRSETTYEERVALDKWYILNWSFWHDILIIAMTFRVVLTRHGAF